MSRKSAIYPVPPQGTSLEKGWRDEEGDWVKAIKEAVPRPLFTRQEVDYNLAVMHKSTILLSFRRTRPIRGVEIPPPHRKRDYGARNEMLRIIPSLPG